VPARHQPDDADEHLGGVDGQDGGGSLRVKRALQKHRDAHEQQEQHDSQVETTADPPVGLLRVRGAERRRVLARHDASLDPRPARSSAPTATGIVKVNRLPRPGVLSTSIVPPRRSTSRFTMCSPSPTPPKRRVEEPSTWRNISKITGMSPGLMPIPVSRTRMV